MKFMRGVMVGLILTSIFHLWVFGWADWSQALKIKWEHVYDDPFSFFGNRDQFNQQGAPMTMLPEMDATEDQDRAFSQDEEVPLIEDQSPELFIGMSIDQLEEQVGEPVRIEPSGYGYQWWIYNQHLMSYIQVGVDDDRVVTFYTNAPQWSWSGLTPGMSQDEWTKEWQSQDDISFHYDLGFYTFSLTSTELSERPLYVEGQTAVQLYIDIHDVNKLSGIRVMDLKTLLLHRPYALKYVGKLPNPPSFTVEEQQHIATANEEQVLDIVNVSRSLKQLPQLKWHEQVADVARDHSLDMSQHQFFDHHSPHSGDLANRLERGQVSYRGAGENIAWNYVDAAAVHEGWLNSWEHRQNVLHEDFTHMGVGVVDKYYTQNFITP